MYTRFRRRNLRLSEHTHTQLRGYMPLWCRDWNRHRQPHSPANNFHWRKHRPKCNCFRLHRRPRCLRESILRPDRNRPWYRDCHHRSPECSCRRTCHLHRCRTPYMLFRHRTAWCWLCAGTPQTVNMCRQYTGSGRRTTSGRKMYRCRQSICRL